MTYQRKTQSIQQSRQAESLQAQVAKQAALLEYVAEMADVELPESEESDEQEG